MDAFALLLPIIMCVGLNRPKQNVSEIRCDALDIIIDGVSPIRETMVFDVNE
jgi:hypothetical protein